MALIRCKECGKEISDNAVSCPNCGCVLKYTESKKIVIKKSNISRSGTMMCIIGSALFLGFVIILVLASILPDTTKTKEYTNEEGITINVTVGEEVETNTQILSIYLISIGVISIIIIVLGVLYLKHKISEKHITLYGISMLILSILLGAMLILTSNCCFQFIFISSIICFIGSVMIIVGNIKEQRNEIRANN